MAEIISFADARKGRVLATVARIPPISHRSDKKALIQALLNDIAANLGVDLSVPEKPR